MHRSFKLTLGLCVIVTLVSAAGAAIPNPTVSGPIPLTSPIGDAAHGYPFFATNLDIASRGL